MIIAAYAGAGKSTFAQQVGGAFDLASMPYSRILPPEQGKKRECEAEKAAPYLLPNPQYPYNYVLDILKAEREYEYVLIPTSASVIRMLNEMGRTVVLCYPTREQKEDYRKRFLERGNSQDFLDVFIDCWEDFLSPFWTREREGIHIPLEKGQFLTDVKAAIDEAAARASMPPAEDALLDGLREKVEERRHGALCVRGMTQSCVYRIRDIQDPEERQFLYEIGRTAYESDLCRPEIWDEEMIRLLLDPPRPGRFRTDDRSAVRQFLEEERLRWSTPPRDGKAQDA